jgi:hypothetical protein
MGEGVGRMTDTIIGLIILGTFYIISAIGAWLGIRNYYKEYEKTAHLTDVLCVIMPFLNTFVAWEYFNFIGNGLDINKFFGLKKEKK